MATRRRTRAAAAETDNATENEADEGEEEEEVVVEPKAKQRKRAGVFEEIFNSFFTPHQVYSKDQAIEILKKKCNTSTHYEIDGFVECVYYPSPSDADDLAPFDPEQTDTTLNQLKIGTHSLMQCVCQANSINPLTVAVFFVTLGAALGSHFCHHTRFRWIHNKEAFYFGGLSNVQRYMLFVRGSGMKSLPNPTDFTYAGVWKPHSSSSYQQYLDLVL